MGAQGAVRFPDFAAQARDPWGFAVVRQKALHLDVGRRKPFQRPDAEGLDPHPPAQCADPAATREQAIAGALDMQEDLGRDVTRLGGDRRRNRPGSGRSRNGLPGLRDAIPRAIEVLESEIRLARLLLEGVSGLGLILVLVIGGRDVAAGRMPWQSLLGLLLGWLAWRTGSIVPGMILHALHNSALMLLGYYKQDLLASGWLQEADRLPPSGRGRP